MQRNGIATQATLLVAIPCALTFLAGCETDGKSAPSADKPLLDSNALKDPSSCNPCHAGHVAGWAASQHAEASRDPVFLAMNRRGQEETHGALGTFCVKCHAPLAVAEGLTTDGLNLDTLPAEAQGISCYYCHSVAQVEADHNNGLVLADDDVVRGPIENPLPGAPHRTEYSRLHDREYTDGSALCGSCHDVTLDNGVKLERTALQWRESAFAPGNGTAPSRTVGCGGCHMPESPDFDTAPGSVRRGHDHHFAAVDIPLHDVPAVPGTDNPLAGAYDPRALVQSALDISLGVEICVQPMTTKSAAFYVTVENIVAGHHYPSGASHDRRVWLEVIAYDAAGKELYASGRTAPDEGTPDDDLWSFHDEALKGDGTPAHMFWDTASLREHALVAAVTFDPSSKDATANTVTRRYPASRTQTVPGTIARVTVKARVRPIGLDVLDDLVASGHLDRAVRDRMPLFDVVPNRHLTDPAFQGLTETTFEWSDAVRNSGRFATRIVNDDSFPRLCVSSAAAK